MRAFPTGDRLGTGATDTRADAIEGSYKISFDPTSSSYDLFSGFVQDDITLVADRLSLSLGSKFEHNDFSGFEYQPGARLLWTPDERQTLWGGVTRAVRTPARADRDVHINLRSFLSKELLAGFGLDLEPDPAVALVVVKGNPAFGTEKIRAYEVGYRIRPQPALLIDLAAYYNDYDDLRSGSNEFPVVEDDPVPHLAFGTSITNFMHGTARGLEMSADWQVADDRARLRGAYTYLDLDLDVEPGGNRDSDLVEIGNSEHQFYLWSALNLRWDLSVDAIFRYAGLSPNPFWKTRRTPTGCPPETSTAISLSICVSAGGRGRSSNFPSPARICSTATGPNTRTFSSIACRPRISVAHMVP